MPGIKNRFISEYYRRALAIFELLMVKHGMLLYLDVISAVATSMLCL